MGTKGAKRGGRGFRRLVVPVVFFVAGVATAAYLLRDRGDSAGSDLAASPVVEAPGVTAPVQDAGPADANARDGASRARRQDSAATAGAGARTGTEDTSASALDTTAGELPGAGATMLAWLAPLCLLLIGALFLAHRRTHSRVRDLETGMDELRRQVSSLKPNQVVYPSSTREETSSPPHGDVTDLWSAVKDMQDDIQELGRKVAAGPDRGGPVVTRQETGALRPPPPPPRPPERLDVKVLAGILSPDDHVRLTNSSLPMVEIHWRDGEQNAEVWVNPEFKFADLTADLLESAFEVMDGGGPGAYETLRAAQVEWGAGASSGRVTQRGRVRPQRG